MPFFNEPFETQHSRNHRAGSHFVYSLSDSFERRIPVTSIEFNPPPVSCFAKQEVEYWHTLETPDEEDRTILKALKAKIRNMGLCHQSGSFMSVTDSAAGVLRMHNLTMLRLLNDAGFTETWLREPPVVLDPRRTILHLTRNHGIDWLKRYLDRCRQLSFSNLLLITGDPLKEVRLKPITFETSRSVPRGELDNYRLKNSVELVCFVKNHWSGFFTGIGHNPFLRKEAAHSHLVRKHRAGADFIITQPVSYYEECWKEMDEFQRFCSSQAIEMPVILGVFNYSVPCGRKGYREEVFQTRYHFWKRLFGFVPDGVKRDYELGLDGIEILARSINKLKRMGSFHFDVMNAEKKGWSIIKDGQRLTHELDRIVGSFDQEAGPPSSRENKAGSGTVNSGAGPARGRS